MTASLSSVKTSRIQRIGQGLRRIGTSGSRMVGLLLLAICILWQLTSITGDRSLLNRLDFILYDARLALGTYFTSLQQATPVVIVDVDEASLRAEGRWPWSRDKLAQLVTNLGQAGVSSVGFDMVFAEPEESALLQWLQQTQPAGIDHEQVQRLLSLWSPDQHLAQAMAATEAVPGFFFQTDAELHSGQLPNPVATLPKDAQRTSVMIERQGYSANLPIIANAAKGGGFVTTFADADGVIRRTPLLISHNGQVYPSLALATAMNFLLLDNVSIDFEPVGDVLTVASLQLSDQTIHTDGLGRVLVPYQRGHSGIRYLSATQVLHKDPSKLGLEGAVVIVGGSAIGLFDRINTPLATAFPGVEVQATVLKALLAGDFPYRPAWQPGATFLQLCLIGLLLIWLLPRRSPLMLALLSLLTTGLVLGLNFWGWVRAGLDLPLTSSLLLILALTLWFAFEGFARESGAKRKVTAMFGQYVPSAHIEQMIQHPDSYSMEGSNREMTVLFSDIRSFTTISESLNASALKAMLNLYFTPITETIFRHGGTVDKYVGDMVMAFWGAPLDDPQHRRNAILAALEMIQVTQGLKEELARRGLPEIKVGIGLNSGFMNVGDMGSEYRKAYTVLGDAVNLGSRLESLTKFYGVDILVGESTRAGVEDIAFRLVDRMLVKGKNEPIDAYEPLGLLCDVHADDMLRLQLYHEALERYRQQQWEDAADLFQQLQQQEPARKIHGIYLQRIAELRTQQLPADWDGAYRHTEK